MFYVYIFKEQKVLQIYLKYVLKLQSMYYLIVAFKWYKKSLFLSWTVNMLFSSLYKTSQLGTIISRWRFYSTNNSHRGGDVPQCHAQM